MKELLEALEQLKDIKARLKFYQDEIEFFYITDEEFDFEVDRIEKEDYHDNVLEME